jgi:hypothetical protein
VAPKRRIGRHAQHEWAGAVDAATADIQLRLTRGRGRTADAHHGRSAVAAVGIGGFRHITLDLPAQPYPAHAARWVADELITKSAVATPPHRRTRRSPLPHHRFRH